MRRTGKLKNVCCKVWDEFGFSVLNRTACRRNMREQLTLLSLLTVARTEVLRQLDSFL